MYNCMFVSALPDPTCNSEKSANGGNKQILLLLLLLFLNSNELLSFEMSESTFESQVARFEKPAFLNIHDLKGCRENHLILKKNNFPLLRLFTLTDNTFMYNFNKVRLSLKTKH